MGRRGRSALIAMRVLCTIALLLLAFAHTPMAAASVTVDSAAYVLPDGSVPTLCTISVGTNGKFALKPACDVCRLNASTDLPAPGDVTYLVVRQAVLSNPLQAETAVFGSRPKSRPNSRAPPQAV